jgi:hypothetical protein
MVVEASPVSCNIGGNPIHRVGKNETTGELAFVANNSSLNNGTLNTNGTRLRRRTSMHVFDNRQQTDVVSYDNENAEIPIDLRECTCGQQERFFCPSRMNTCVLSDSSGERPTCYYASPDKDLGEILWLLFVAWIIICTVALVLTRRGRTVLEAFILTVCPKYNVFVANRMLERNPEAATAMIRGYMERREHAMMAQHYRYAMYQNQAAIVPLEETQAPTSLELKTCIFHSEEDKDEPIECTICFATLEKGDRVGAFPCRHVFHVGCLKTWLKRRNVCPLCLANNVASPQYSI